jgi:hypothetical protein
MVQIIDKFVNKLIDNLPENMKNKDKPIIIDLVLGGGAFNGSYLIGALYFLKEMEKRGYIIIERISGCSIGSILGLFYLIDELDSGINLYKKVAQQFKKDYDLAILKDLRTICNGIVPSNICDIINKKLYICYNNIKTRKKIVKTQYHNIENLYDTIIKSSFVPIIIDGTIAYKNKYIDGVNPYIFKYKKDRKILFLDLYTFDKLHLAFNIKNEQSNIHRVLSGLLDINMFFIKQENTKMCSYKNRWNISEWTFYIVKYIVEKIIVYILSILLYLKKIMSCNVNKNVTFKIFYEVFKKLKILCLNTYCL